MNHRLMLSLVVLGMTSCATVKLPSDLLQGSEASIRSAEEMGAASVPEARLHLEYAKDQTAKAKKMAADGDDRAVLVLARGQADAELALGLARENAVHDDAQRAAEDLKAVRARGAP